MVLCAFSATRISHVASSEFDAQVIANFGAAVAVADDTGKLWRAVALKKLPLLVAGDRVRCRQDHQARSVASDDVDETVPFQFDPQADVLRITALHKRSSVLQRPDRRQKLKPLAANLTQLVIVASVLPAPESRLIDQFFVYADVHGLNATLVLNKTDLADNEALEPLVDLLAVYESLGYQTCRFSAKPGRGSGKSTGNTTFVPDAEQLAHLKSLFANEVSVLVGQSGVGKSSIANLLLPDQHIRTGQISEATGVGTHTTTVSCYYELPGGGALIDSPGVRQFAVDYLDNQQIATGYREIHQTGTHCRFNNCQHDKEPDCAVRAAVEEGRIARFRFENFTALLAETAERRDSN